MCCFIPPSLWQCVPKHRKQIHQPNPRRPQQRIFLAVWKTLFCALRVSNAHHPKGEHYSNLYHQGLLLFAFGLHINGIISCILFDVQLPFLNSMRVTHAVLCNISSFSVMLRLSLLFENAVPYPSIYGQLCLFF